jgi:hypothetical protein
MGWASIDVLSFTNEPVRAHELATSVVSRTQNRACMYFAPKQPCSHIGVYAVSEKQAQKWQGAALDRVFWKAQSAVHLILPLLLLPPSPSQRVYGYLLEGL